VGAWIETYKVDHDVGESERVGPTWARGLKHSHNAR
jgi:hypothetical protein